MGASKLPIFAYVDETGNTGKNIFDPNQPDFITAALVNKGDFDAQRGKQIKAIAAQVGADAIHANELGIGRLETVAGQLFDVLESSGAHFFISRVEKRYLLATKMYDTFFDSGENAAVAWHNYNVKPLKILLAFKLAAIINDEIAREFWDFLLVTKREEALKRLPGICRKLIARLDLLPDARSREVLGQGLDWIIKHPESVHVVDLERKIAKQGHFANMVAFSNLLRGIEEFSKRWKKKIGKIIHDEQNEFGTNLRLWHQMHANALPDVIDWAGEKYSFQLAPGSEFIISQDGASAGIQMADMALWLYAQHLKGKELPRGCARILRLVLERGWHSDFSFQGVHDSVMEQWGEVLFGPMEAEKLEAGKEMVAQAEKTRHASMSQYEADGLAPFERSNPPHTVEG